MPVIKNPTSWRPPSGNGSTVTVGSLSLVTNAGKTIVANVTHYPIVTTPTYTKPKTPTTWTQVG